MGWIRITGKNLTAEDLELNADADRLDRLSDNYLSTPEPDGFVEEDLGCKPLKSWEHGA